MVLFDSAKGCQTRWFDLGTWYVAHPFVSSDERALLFLQQTDPVAGFVLSLEDFRAEVRPLREFEDWLGEQLGVNSVQVYDWLLEDDLWVACRVAPGRFASFAPGHGVVRVQVLPQ
jgi:hypothetical protein